MTRKLNTPKRIKQLRKDYTEKELRAAFDYCYDREFRPYGELSDQREAVLMRERWSYIFMHRIRKTSMPYKDIARSFFVTITPITRTEDIIYKDIVAYLEGEKIRNATFIARGKQVKDAYERVEQYSDATFEITDEEVGGTFPMSGEQYKQNLELNAKLEQAHKDLLNKQRYLDVEIQKEKTKIGMTGEEIEDLQKENSSLREDLRFAKDAVGRNSEAAFKLKGQVELLMTMLKDKED